MRMRGWCYGDKYPPLDLNDSLICKIYKIGVHRKYALFLYNLGLTGDSNDEMQRACIGYGINNVPMDYFDYCDSM